MDLLRERQDAQIWNAIEASNYKQALKLVDKRLAKKHTDYLEALRIYIRAKLPQLPEQSAILIHLEELAGRKPPLLDPEAIGLYDETLTELSPNSHERWAKLIGELRWQCVKASPKNEDLSRDAFKACLHNDDLEHARQIANSLEKTFPANHSYVFWNITLMFMISICPTSPVQSKSIWGGLALAHINKLADASRKAESIKKLPTRSIQTPQELLLMHRILEDKDRASLRLEYLQDSNLGPESAIAKGEWELWRFQLQLLENAHDWEGLFNTTLSLLKRARTKNNQDQLAESAFGDWIVWEKCISSAIKFPGKQSHSKLRNELEAHIDPESGIDKSWRRSATLAWVKFQYEVVGKTRAGVLGNVDESSIEHKVLLEYFQRFSIASTTYNDLAPFTKTLSAHQREELLSKLQSIRQVSTASEIARTTNALKFAYLLNCSKPEDSRRRIGSSSSAVVWCDCCSKTYEIDSTSRPQPYCPRCVKTLAGELLMTYHKALLDDSSITENLLSTDRHPADDIVMLASMCLVKLSQTEATHNTNSLESTTISYILQATAILEYAYQHSKANFQINLMLIRFYSYLGCGSLAMHAYHRLGLKQIQLDTLSYTFFEHISTLHPHVFNHALEGTKDIRTPEESVKKQTAYYEDGLEQCRKNVWLCFKHDSFNSIFGIREVTDRLERSMGAVRCFVESRKLTRFLRPAEDLGAVSQRYLDLALATESTLENNNDYDSFPTFETADGPSFEEISRLHRAPEPTDEYYASLCFTEQLWSILTSEPSATQLSTNHQFLCAYLKKPSIGSASKDQDNQTSDVYNVTLRLAKLLKEITSPSSRWEEPIFTKELEELHAKLLTELDYICTKVQKCSTPVLQADLEVLYTSHSTATLCLTFCLFTTKAKALVYQHPGFTKSNTQLANKAKQLAKDIVEKCSSSKKALDEGGWIDRVLECLRAESGGRDTLSGKVEALVGDDFMESWAGDVVESWRESTVGLGLLKVPS